MNKRDAAILNWVRTHRFDVLERFEKLTQTMTERHDDPMSQATLMLMYFAFEGGRQFQHDTNAELNHPELYL